ncbi:MAG: hypothetical protein JO163_10930 [Methylobacteriaceae bacterium]|nr:hypothetical protein [Methylobacteriaceae bacterium]MBV9220851.1 hypothetical protein [Methylobacteriaceae bacterium]MBV9636248.1 hypothetical protein [Methylobacteriaceae bacterium]MBV9703232.1 hypothetical protein [Methylobacteriaceae bacterium]
MKLLKFWPFEVADEYENTSAPLNIWLPRSLIVGIASGLASAVLVLLGSRIF